MVLASFHSWFGSPLLGLDIGTANTRGVLLGLGTSFAEPSMVLTEDSTTKDGRRVRHVVGVGNDAIGAVKEHGTELCSHWPVRHGVLAERKTAEDLFRHLFARRYTGYRRRPGMVLATVPADATAIERSAIEDVVRVAGVKSVVLIEGPRAAALGAGLPIDEPRTSLVGTIGAGITEIALLSMGGIVASRSERVGGDDMDRAIVTHVRRSYGVAINKRTAEHLKTTIGSACAPEFGCGRSMRVSGSDIVTGTARAVTVSERDVAIAMTLPLYRISEAIREFLEATTTEISADHEFDTLLLTGGGSLLTGLASAVEETVGLRTLVVPDPMDATVKGLRLALTQVGRLQALLEREG